MKTITVELNAYTIDELNGEALENAISVVDKLGIELPGESSYVTETRGEVQHRMLGFLSQVLGAQVDFSETTGELEVSDIDDNGEPISRGMSYSESELKEIVPTLDIGVRIERMKILAENVIRLYGIGAELEDMYLTSVAEDIVEAVEEKLGTLSDLANRTMALIIGESVLAQRFNEVNSRGMLFNKNGTIIQL